VQKLEFCPEGDLVMTVKTIPIRLSTQGNADIQDITNAVEAAVRQYDLSN
jgi:thiamine phosphate synthase YjbQ (UPF0047 family)